MCIKYWEVDIAWMIKGLKKTSTFVQYRSDYSDRTYINNFDSHTCPDHSVRLRANQTFIAMPNGR